MFDIELGFQGPSLVNFCAELCIRNNTFLFSLLTNTKYSGHNVVRRFLTNLHCTVLM
jgi:hypothetical protein